MYGQTWLDLQTTPPIIAWQMLRNLRHRPPGRANKGHRKDTFGAALEQAEQLFSAASNVGPASRPLLAFYGISQAGRAIAAAAGNVDNSGYRISGHGIQVATSMEEIGKKVGIANLYLVDQKSGAFPQLAAILGAASFQEQTRFGDIWGLLPESVRFPFEGLGDSVALRVSLASPSAVRTMDAVPADVLPIPRTAVHLTPDGIMPGSLTADDILTERANITGYLSKYPTLNPWRFAEPDGDRLRLTFDSSRNAQVRIEWAVDRRAERHRTSNSRTTYCQLQGHPVRIPEYWWQRPGCPPFPTVVGNTLRPINACSIRTTGVGRKDLSKRE